MAAGWRRLRGALIAAGAVTALHELIRAARAAAMLADVVRRQDGGALTAVRDPPARTGHPRASPGLGAEIRRRRRQLGLTQLQLATAVGATQPAVSRWELDQGTPSTRMFARLAHALDVDDQQLQTWVDTLDPRGRR